LYEETSKKGFSSDQSIVVFCLPSENEVAVFTAILALQGVYQLSRRILAHVVPCRESVYLQDMVKLQA